MNTAMPEKALYLDLLKKGQFNVPDFIYVPAEDFKQENFDALAVFLESHKESYKVIARSAHPRESFYKGGTFESLETYADVGGIRYARKRMIKSIRTTAALSIKRQQKFNNAPPIDPEEMGVVVMPFIDGASVMAKKIGNEWEFGYCRERSRKVQTDPYITKTPHDARLLQMSEDIEAYLGCRCEIEYLISEAGKLHLVQAKDISSFEMLEQKESERSIRLDGLRRFRKRRNYRERPIYVMDNRAFYIDLISKCEDFLQGEGKTVTFGDILDLFSAYQETLETFALKHERFGILGISIHEAEDLFQIANHFLDDLPDLQERLTTALHQHLYATDTFLTEADTLIAKDRFRVNLCTHDAYGIDTVRTPRWYLYWNTNRHEQVLKEIKRIGFKTGDTVGIDVDTEEIPTLFRW